jgi:putative transposase
MKGNQPHRKKVKHYHEPGHLHEFTFSCYRRIPLLTNDDWRKRLAKCLGEANQEHAFELVAFVFMPEHVHLLVYPLSDEPQIGHYLARVKQPFSKQIKNILVDAQSPLLEKLTVRERPGKTCFRFWQEGPGFDRNLYSPDAIAASIDYIHNNPVARELCHCAIDWKWSSSRYYHGSPPKQQFPDLPFIHGLPIGAFDEPTT